MLIIRNIELTFELNLLIKCVGLNHVSSVTMTAAVVLIVKSHLFCISNRLFGVKKRTILHPSAF